ncbi:MAG: glucose-6-phosphate dehydrogenase [Candidatus Rokuibacteriota bacterium]|nr:MAG: glucose-6-phosphate dehydrogenase [Candidatus Rokubacteria bacterium]
MDERFTLIIFGASGDLTKRKLIPALWSLYQGRTLPEPFSIIAIARGDLSTDAFRTKMRAAVTDFARVQPPAESVWERFAASLSYCSGDPKDPALYVRLGRLLEAHPNRLFYCATPPSLSPEIVTRLGEAGLARSHGGWTRIIIEKPFGRDLESAQALNALISGFFRERQVYRIDHYLGKETVQNILVFRFANGIFEPLWNRQHVDHVQITVGESIGVGSRGVYYEEAGALRDMVQNHMLQLLCLIAMEPPVTFDADPVRDEKNKVMRALKPIEGDSVDEFAVRGQYGPGFVTGERVPGYREEPGVRPDSTAETYAALKLFVQNWRWAGVPFYLRTGKRLPKRVSEIAIEFKPTPHLIFRREPSGVRPNVLVLRIQPDEGMSLTVEAKTPGPDLQLNPVTMDFHYGAVFGSGPPEAYERLLLDAIHGDATLYARGDWVEYAWAALEPVLRAWSDGSTAKFPNYAAGSWGPAEADAFIERDGRKWRRP